MKGLTWLKLVYYFTYIVEEMGQALQGLLEEIASATARLGTS